MMLKDPIMTDTTTPMEKPLSSQDKDILRHLAEQLAAYAALPVQKEKARLWTQLNNLEKTRPLVWIEEVPWHEMNVNEELTNQTTHPWALWQETQLRRRLYQWRHFPVDMVLSDYLASPLAIDYGHFGLEVQADVIRTDEASEIISHRYHRQITEPEDIDKIKMPVVTHDLAATEAMFQRMREVYGGIMPIRKEGIKFLWFTPWDYLVQWWGVEQALMDLALRPQMVNDIVARFVDACLCQLDQYEALNLLALNHDNGRIGSGGYGYCDQLPGSRFDPAHIRPGNMWGCSNAQIFSEVSPEMHWEFALRHELRWLERWGLTYYGCCEPLDGKMDLLRRIPNLRKISMSAWIKLDRAVREVGDRYVFSYKPSPALLAEDDWDPAGVRRVLQTVVDQTADCRVEIILKDISTVRHQPQRLWEFGQIAMDVVAAAAL